ncbi:MAG TPA: DNA polymerase [Blastocatellia bacterium]|nr:DNA polymerase [Blastocatellia bacterium]
MADTAYTIVEDRGSLDHALAELANQPVAGLDTETTSLDPFAGRIRLIQISSPVNTFVIDTFKVDPFESPAFGRLLSSPSPVKVLHNAKFDAKMLLHHFGVELRGLFDTFLASKLVAAGRGDTRHGLSDVSERYLGKAINKSLQSSPWDGQLSSSQYEYAAADAAVLLPLHGKLSDQIQQMKLAEVAGLEFDCVLPLAAMELAGMAIDVDCWNRLAADVEHAHAILSSDLRRELAPGIEQPTLFGEPDINLDSPAQIVETLARMGIKVEGTRSSQLQPLAKEYPVVQKLLEYRGVQKALSSYGYSMLDHVNPMTGRLHASFHQIGATGGRMSCSDPNLQQIPNSPEYRSCFRPPAGHKLVVADYSQIELRILADWSQDTALVKALASGEDLHSATASQMLGVPLGDVSKAQRAVAKQLNYGLIYGLGPHGLAARIDSTVEEAEDLIRKYFDTYRGVAEWLREAADHAVRERQCRTRSGRLILIDFDPSDRAERAAVERLGKNSPIQGSSADITKRALALLYPALKPLDCAIVNCIHDEIVVEVSQEQAQECRSTVEHQMIAAAHHFIRSVPVTVDAVISDAWLK